MLDNINEILLTATVGLAAAAIALRLMLRVNRVDWLKRFMNWLLGYVDVFLSALVIALAIRSTIVEPFTIPSSSMENTLLVGDHLFVNRFIYGLRVTQLHVGAWHPFAHRPLAVRAPRRGDIVVFIPPHQRDRDFIKRVIGTPGDTVEIRDQDVWVNGTKLDEPYVVHKDYYRFFGSARDRPKAVVPPGKAWVFPAPAGGWIVAPAGATTETRGGRVFVNGTAVRRGRPAPSLEWDRLAAVRDNEAAFTVPPDRYFMMGDNRDNSEDSRFWGFAKLEDMKGNAMIIYFSYDPQVTLWPPSLDLLHWVRWSRLLHVVH